MSLTPALQTELTDVLTRRRQRTLSLVEPLDDDAVHRQVVDFLSPLVWDIGHVGNFEELWLLRNLDGREAHDADLDRVYNPFENPRWTRGELDVLPRAEALTYLDHVRSEAIALLGRLEADDPLVADGYVHRMIAQHESQHQETLLQALDLSSTLEPFAPAAPRPRPATPYVDDEARVTVPGGDVPIGTDTLRWTYDNERPAHTRRVEAFAIDVHPVTNRRFAAFVEAGGYDPEGTWWSDRGRGWLADEGHVAPQGWHRAVDGEWTVRRFGWELPLDPREPVQHVSFFEAEAFAAWAGGRLPTEFEWEAAALWDPSTGATTRHPWGDADPSPRTANIGLTGFGPTPVGSHPGGASPHGVQGLVGDVYEWTSSQFEPYPGYTSFPYPEYSEVFFGGDWRVLRGSSWAIAASMGRGTYRNWDHPYRRQVFAGLRVARDA